MQILNTVFIYDHEADNENTIDKAPDGSSGPLEYT